MAVASLVEDERTKLRLPRSCCYCGSEAALTLDYLLPTSRGGADEADNVVCACRRCNSKGGNDLIEWHESRREFPPLLFLRRYLKLAIEVTEGAKLMGATLSEIPDGSLPYDPSRLPHRFPLPGQLRLWVPPTSPSPPTPSTP